jgi:NAD(P)H-hydrate epimerase
MVIRPLTCAEARSLDERAIEELGLPTLVLMENAGRGAADLLAKRAARRARALILCGPGNNGGDGGVVARFLDAWGFPVRIVWFAHPDRFTADAALQHRVLDRAGLSQEVWDGPVDSDQLAALLSTSDWVVDGLLGTGLTRSVTGPLRTVIEAMNSSGKPILALDVPSGLDADTGEPRGVAVHATLTATFAATKVGFIRPGAGAYTGPVHVIEIGLPRALLEPFRSV